MTDPGDNYGKISCIRCGECCEPFIMEEEFVERFRSRFQRPVLREQHFPHINAALVRTNDNKCVFLFPDNTCSVYESRPEFPCKMFGIPFYLECPKVTPEGKMRSKEEYEKIIAKNADRSQWSEEYKKKLGDLAEKRVEEVIRQQKKETHRILQRIRSGAESRDPRFLPAFHGAYEVSQSRKKGINCSKLSFCAGLAGSTNVSCS